MLLIGPSGVGKTSLLLKYVQNRFSYDYQVTSGIEFYTKEVPVNERNAVNLQIWDTMGQEAYKSVVKSHYKGVAAVIFFYSLEKMETFERLGAWVKEVREHVHEETVYYLVGTKLDLEDVRRVPKEEGEGYCKSIKATFFLEISSKTGENVKELFDKIAKHLFKKYQSSKAFKELVRPVASGFAKTESFRLRREDGVKGVQKKSGCC